MKVYMTTVDCCNDCPFVLHEEFGYTRCPHLDKVVHSESIDADCPLPEFEMVNEGSNADIITD